MIARIAKKALLPLLLLGTTLLGGCYYTPYGYYPGYGYGAGYAPVYAPAPIYGGVVVGGPFFGRRYYR